MAQATMEFASEAVRSETLALDAIEHFYEAVNRIFAGDSKAMEDVWVRSADALLQCPFGGRSIGWPEIQGQLGRDTHEMKGGGLVLPRDLVIRRGEELAYGVCFERGQMGTKSGQPLAFELRATSILRRQGNEWRVIYHHGDPLPEMKEAPHEKKEFAAPKGEKPDSRVLEALGKFHQALGSMFQGDLGPLGRIWANTDDVTFAGPTGNIQVGWEAVRAEFQRHSQQTVRGDLQFKEPFVRVFGDLAYASYLASAPDMTINGKPYPFEQRATSIFRLEGGQWRLVHQHLDLAPGLAELCGGEKK